MQANDHILHSMPKMAIITEENVWVQPQAYFPVTNSAVPPRAIESGSLSAQVQNWSKMEVGAKVTHIDADHDKVKLSNGKTFSYKALVLAPGFEHSTKFIKGLDQFEKTNEKEGIFCHLLDKKTRCDRNFYHGWHNTDGDLLCYAPKLPYKGEGSTFYALYYENMMITDKIA